ncbi:MAG TPA: malto-oligosyltrehalose synthase [Polyangiaceae bacterium]|nr:malto-oligosyltrehalose synthase [Polyangiaceae bacterium]
MRIPTATYRLQFTAAFGFDAGQRAVDYLATLGISDVYSSPICTARAGSNHGYDVVSHEDVSPELGGEDAFRALGLELRRRNMGILLDVVPNHMCVADDANWRWGDVLENGPSAPSARFFDIDWRPPKPELAGRVLLPILPDQFGSVVVDGQFTPVYGASGFALRYADRRLPLAPKSWLRLLEPALGRLRETLGDVHADVLELESVVRALQRLPARTETSPDRLQERQHELPIIKNRLFALYQRNADFRGTIEEVLLRVRGRKGEPASFEDLAGLLSDQAYRLSFWRVALHEINYRRFFDVNDLAAIRVEDPEVFAAVHILPLRLAKEGLITGLRIDHVDGLYDPLRYLRELQQSWQAATTDATEAYVVVEKILARDERIPAEWPVAGTTGYEFMNLVTGVLVDVPRVWRLHRLSERLGGEDQTFADVIYECKKLILQTTLVAELGVLARQLDRISEQHMFTRDFTRLSLQDALAEVIACFPVYRTYVRPDQASVDSTDRDVIERALRDARRRNPVTHESVFDFIGQVLLLDAPDGLQENQRRDRRHFVMKFQQVTGPVMAKGVEDTAFYRYFPLAALEEVGGHPESMGTSLAQFHRKMVERAEHARRALSATDTHDAKRSEDARARLSVLSEISEEWEKAVDRFRELNRGMRVEMPGFLAPDDHDEYLFYQSVLSIWPPGIDSPPADLVERVSSYMMKAIHEAKRHSSWINPSRPYDDGVAAFVTGALDRQRSGPFLDALGALRRRIELPGLWNSLSQTVLKIAAPGVPDFYQGSESWAFHLVDPDNRGLIDFDERQRILTEVVRSFEHAPTGTIDTLLAHPHDGRIKMLVTTLALRHRRRCADLMNAGSYLPLEATGQRAAQIVAFLRKRDHQAAIILTGRFFTRLGEAASLPTGKTWGDTVVTVPADWRGRSVRDAFTQETFRLTGSDGTSIDVAHAFAHLPVAMLEVLP